MVYVILHYHFLLSSSLQREPFIFTPTYTREYAMFAVATEIARHDDIDNVEDEIV